MSKLKNYWLFIFLLITISSNAITAPSAAVKQQALAIYQNHRFTFFCGQTFTDSGAITWQACQDCPLQSGKITWMNIVPLKVLSQDLPCQQHKICFNQQGQSYRGLRCCLAIDPIFKKMFQDLHNWVPEIPPLAKLRAGYQFGTIISDYHETLNGCNFKLDPKYKILEPAALLKGFIARTYLYMHYTYHGSLSPEDLALFEQWNFFYPSSSWEQQREAAIFMQQQQWNPWITPL